MTRSRTRRGFLRLGGAVLAAGATVGLAGCGGDGDGGNGNGNGNGNGDGTGVLDVVPESATSVTYADVGGMIEDATVEELLNEMFATAAENDEEYDGPTDTGEMLDDIEAEAGLDPREMDESVAFGKVPEMEETPVETMEPADQYSATWFTAGWSEDDLVAAIEDQFPNFELEAGEYNGYTVYEPVPAGEGEMTPPPGMEGGSPARIAVIADGEYVTGTTDAVEDVLDVAAGDADAAGDDIREAYGGVRDGLMKVATTDFANLPDEELPQGTVGEDGPAITPGQFEDVEGGAFVMYTEDDELGMSTSMTATDEEAAGEIVEIIDGALSTAKTDLQEADEELAAELDEIDVARDGRSVSISYATSVENGTSLVERIVELFTAGMQSTPIETDGGGYAIPFPV
jgi:hypothetical protein